MSSNTRNILEELQKFVPDRSKYQIFESRANNIVSSCMNLIQQLHEEFDEDVANELSRRLLLSIKNSDPDKFSRKLREVSKK